MLVSARTADEADKIAQALAAILTPPTAAEIQRHIKLGDGCSNLVRAEEMPDVDHRP